MRQRKLVLVVSGKIWQYREWVRDHSGVSSRCVVQEHDCYGYDPKTCLIAFAGTWWNLPDRVLSLIRYRFGESERFVETVQNGGHSGTTHNRPMFTIKEDWEPITWDDEGMAGVGRTEPPR